MDKCGSTILFHLFYLCRILFLHINTCLANTTENQARCVDSPVKSMVLLVDSMLLTIAMETRDHFGSIFVLILRVWCKTPSFPSKHLFYSPSFPFCFTPMGIWSFFFHLGYFYFYTHFSFNIFIAFSSFLNLSCKTAAVRRTAVGYQQYISEGEE